MLPALDMVLVEYEQAGKSGVREGDQNCVANTRVAGAARYKEWVEP